MERVRRRGRFERVDERPPERGPDPADVVLALQHAAGNQAVARALRGSASGRGALLQREVKVTNIDFDPTSGGGFRHGYIETDNFFAALQTALSEDETLDTDKKKKDFRNQLDNVMKELKQRNHEGSDIDNLAGVLADRMVTEYGKKGLGAARTKRDLFLRHITACLVKHIEASPTKDMDAGEAYGFDLMKKAVEEHGAVEENGVQMSRAKGVVPALPRDKLPHELQTSVKDFAKGRRKETLLWSAATLTPEQMLRNELTTIVSRRQKDENRYQGNHTNRAGWLPPSTAPVNHVARAHDAAYAAAGAGLKAKLDDPYPAKALGMEGAVYGPADPDRTEYLQRIAGPKAGLTDGLIRLSVWAALAQDVSPYIEFSTTDFISRLVYDCVTHQVFVSAHYKWREGYNPWFEVMNPFG